MSAAETMPTAASRAIATGEKDFMVLFYRIGIFLRQGDSIKV